MTEQTFIQKELTKFNITDTVIAEYKETFMPLVLDDLGDKETFSKIHEARIMIRDKRIEVERTGKALRADANSFNKAVLAEEARIIKLLEPIESHLKSEEEKPKIEAERLQKIKDEQEAKRNQERIEGLIKYGCAFNGIGYQLSGLFIDLLSVKIMDDETYSEFAKKIYTERLRLDMHEAEAKAAQAAEAERLRIQKEALDQQKAEQDKIAKELKDKQDAIDEANAKIKRDEELAQARKDAAAQAIKDEQDKAEKARIAEIKRMADTAEAKRLQEIADKTEWNRQESLKPDKEKLTSFAASLLTISKPELSTPEADQILSNAVSELKRISDRIIKQSKEL